MENQNLQPNPEAQNQTPDSPQGDALRNQKINILKSKFFLGFVAFSVLISFLIGGFVLGKNNSGGQKACTQEAKLCPDGSSVGRSGPNCEFTKCPVADSTADWKTYRNAEFTVKYPGDTFIDESTACNFVKINSLGLFKKSATGKYLCGSDEPYYFYINSVDKKEITSNDSCYTVTKEATILDEVPAEKYTTSFHSIDKSCGERGIGPISKEVKSVYITHKAKLYLINWPILDVDETIYDQMLSTFKFTDSTSTTDTSTWKTYTDSFGGFSFKYPSGWETGDISGSSTQPELKHIQSLDYDEASFEGPGPGKVKSGYKLFIRVEANSNFKDYGSYKDFILNLSTGHFQRNDINRKEIVLDGQNCLVSMDLGSTGAYNSECSMYFNGKTIDLSLRSKDKNEKIFNQIISTLKFTQ